MKANACVGRICRATAGRDKNKRFVITAIIDEAYVLIADGVTRPIEKPKRKKLKHVYLEKEILDEIAQKIINNAFLTNAEIKKALVPGRE